MTSDFRYDKERYNYVEQCEVEKEETKSSSHHFAFRPILFIYILF